MWKIKRLCHFHVILIYFTFIFTENIIFDNRYIYSQVIAQSTSTPNTNEDEFTPSSELEQKTPEEIRQIKRQYLDIIEERFFNLKGKPTQTVVENAFVPRAMLEEYVKMRDSVREIIPDDKDFYGKISIDGSVDTHEDFWSAVYNKYGSYDIKVDMGSSNSEYETGYRYKGEASHIAHVPTVDPESVPAKFEPVLPPHAKSVQSQRQFQSVHLKFNLSQTEPYQEPTASDDLRGAELYISRERLYNCMFQECGKQKSVSPQNGNGERNNQPEVSVAKLQEQKLIPRFQRVYILHVYGYDQFGEPRAKIHDSRRIRTDEMIPISFNVYPIVKTWLMNPKSNFGIIVRVTNDDEDYEKALRNEHMMRRRRPQRQTTNSTDLSDELNRLSADLDQESILLDHLRLKRDFRSQSENDDEWLKKGPNILIYSKPSDVERRHVKRHQDEAESMQAEDPDTRLTNESSTAVPINRRDQIPSSPRSRGPPTRNSSGPRTQQSQSSQTRPKPKSKQSSKQLDRCAKRPYEIKFNDVGWGNWIIAPAAYNANYCAGDCSWPLADTQNATNHAIIQAIYQSVGRVVPRSCCAPVKLGKMSILYHLDGMVQLRLYDDMIVEACGCL